MAQVNAEVNSGIDGEGGSHYPISIECYSDSTVCLQCCCGWRTGELDWRMLGHYAHTHFFSKSIPSVRLIVDEIEPG